MEITDIIEVDSAIGNDFVANGEIEDPYKTLKGFVLFLAGFENDSTNGSNALVGLYNPTTGEHWVSNLVITNYTFGATRILKTADINNDGKVEIIVSRKDEQEKYQNSIWIFSWDGTAGTSINAVDGNGESVVFAQTGANPDFVDVNGDGILKIVLTTFPEDGSQSTNTVFSWNGIVYDGQAYQPSPNQFLPRNVLSAIVKPTVSLAGGIYTYSYVITNQASSKQKIDEVMVGTIVDTAGFRLHQTQ